MKRTLLLVLPLLGACSTLSNISMPRMPSFSMPDVSGSVTPYKIDVRQGNYVTQEMVSQLKPGMTKDQVRFALGTPLLMDVFHADRWDYVYRLQEGKGRVEERHITVFFDQGKLVKLAGDVVAASTAAGAALPANQASQVVEIGMTPEAKAAADAVAATPKPAAPESKPWWRSLWPW